MGKSLATFAALIIIAALIAAGIYVYNNVRRDFEVEGTLRLFSEKGLGKTPCGFTGIIDYDNISYQIAVPKDKCELYRAVEGMEVKVTGILVTYNKGGLPTRTPQSGEQAIEKAGTYIIYPSAITGLDDI